MNNDLICRAAGGRSDLVPLVIDDRVIRNRSVFRIQFSASIWSAQILFNDVSRIKSAKFIGKF